MLLLVLARLNCISIDNIFYELCNYFVLKMDINVSVELFRSISGQLVMY